MAKIRADQLVLQKGLCDSRSKAQALIMAGKVRTAVDRIVEKPGSLLDEETELFLTDELQYVSRAALKLLPALEKFQPELQGLIALDLGTSTGGFTEVLLENGVKKVYAVDVGYDQLHDKLRNNDKVIVLERTNARHLNCEIIPDKISVLTADLSFISLTKVLPASAELLAENAWIFVLVKPQFEAARQEVSSGGVVRDLNVQLRCVQEIIDFAVNTFSWQSLGYIPSPIKGPKGNQEYIAVFRNCGFAEL
jgi:23S rRNA (cytidine1920-2'-O)/16S rRNA (cytidine1409-2'-O)-methyltransferase